MNELAQARHQPLAEPQPSVRWLKFGEDRAWLTVMAAVTAVEFAWWMVAWSVGIAPFPYLLTYVALAFAGLACALALRWASQPRTAVSNWPSIVVATILVGIGASLFLPLKYAIPKLVPFWLDEPLASAERSLFGADPWLVLNHFFGWAAAPMDRLYGLWLPTQSFFLFTVVTQPPSARKSRALIAYVLTWFLLGVVAAIVCSSAGPLFHDRIFALAKFAGLRETLQNRGAWVVLAESDKMWTSFASGRPGMVAGISAVPSIHVAISVWIFLVVRETAPRFAPYAFVYAALIWIGSVQLGWHYVADGLAGALGMLAIWVLSRRLQPLLGPPAH